MWYADGLPWRVLTPIEAQLAANPTFLAGEASFCALGLVTLLHAFCHGRRHVLAWVGALVGGTANDIFFMALPFVDNFWHAQGTLMMSARLPFYILMAYVSFIYVPVVASWRLPLSGWAQCLASALSGCLFYAGYDLVGAKFLWWTWHDSDASVFYRWCGVPIGSTMWTACHGLCFHCLLRAVAPPHATLSAARFVGALLVICLLCTPLMMLSMAPFQMHQLRLASPPVDRAMIQIPSIGPFPPISVTQIPGRPDELGLVLCIATMAVSLAIAAQTRANQATVARGSVSDRVLLLVSVAHLATLTTLMATGAPEDVVTTGVHQEYGPCDETAIDLFGYTRRAYLCAESFDEDFTFSCSEQALPPKLPTWYTLCGKAHSHFALYVGLEAALATMAAAALATMLGGRARKKAGGPFRSGAAAKISKMKKK